VRAVMLTHNIRNVLLHRWPYDPDHELLCKQWHSKILFTAFILFLF